LAWGDIVRLEGRPAQLSAISEDGLELRLAADEAGEDWAPGATRLQLSLANGDGWPVELEARSGPRLGCRWGPLKESQRAQLHHLLYQRRGQWPTRRAPAEPLALAATLQRLVRPLPPEDWFQRSLLPVRPPGQRETGVAAEF
jgi:cellulose synthase (UDP-forming)